MSEPVDDQPDEEATAAATIEELDRRVDPLRRVLHFAASAPSRAARVRYLERIGARWLDAALVLPLPAAAREPLDRTRRGLRGLDALEGEARLGRIRDMNQHIRRMDALLGLPMPEQRAAPRSPRPPDRLEPRAQPTSRKRRRPRAPRWSVGPSLDALGLPADLCDDLAAAGVGSVAELLWRAPVGREPRLDVRGAGRETEDQLGERCALGGRVRWRALRLRPDGGRQWVTRIRGAEAVDLVWPEGRGPAAHRAARPGDKVVVFGRLVRTASASSAGRLEQAEIAPGPRRRSVALPRYDLPGVADRDVRLAHHLARRKRGVDPLGPWASRQGLPELVPALRRAHGQGDPEAMRRLAFDDAFLLQLGLAIGRYASSAQRGLSQPVLHSRAAQLLRRLEVELSAPARCALEDVKRDLLRHAPMARVLGGQVGAGKGLIALLAAVMVAEGRAQVVFVASSPSVASAWFLFSEHLLRDLGLVTRLFRGSPSRNERDALQRGQIHVAFGTSELVDGTCRYRRLGLVVSEERGELGAVSRRVRGLRKPRPDLLVVATSGPDARVLLGSLADHDLSWVPRTAGPLARAAVLPERDRMVAYTEAAERVRDGEQLLVLFPLVQDRDAMDARSAAQVAAALDFEVFGGVRFGVLHGSMSREEAGRAFRDFRHHRTDVLVSTVPVEEGPSCPRVSMVVVEQAQHLSLHRIELIRGFITHPRGRCLFVAGGEPAPESLRRLHASVHSGPPDLLTGLPRRGWLRSLEEFETLREARRAAHELLRLDPRLRAPASAELLRWGRWRWPALSDAACPLPEPVGGGRRRRRRRRRSSSREST